MPSLSVETNEVAVICGVEVDSWPTIIWSTIGCTIDPTMAGSIVFPFCEAVCTFKPVTTSFSDPSARNPHVPSSALVILIAMPVILTPLPGFPFLTPID